MSLATTPARLIEFGHVSQAYQTCELCGEITELVNLNASEVFLRLDMPEKQMWMECQSKVTLNNLLEAASLLVSLVWMTNTLANWPDKGGTWNEVCDASSVHEMSGGALVPVWPLQAHFLHSLWFAPNPPPRLSSQRTVAIRTMLYICSSKSPPITEGQLHVLITEPVEVRSNLQLDMLEEGPAEAQTVNPWAIANKQRTVNARVKERWPNLFADVLPEPEQVRHYELEDEDYEEHP
ncbi:hypothetical protein FRC06_003534 [Ceratobasidium sp. 370]|nr:hypothetical protein FRC06_003534 [Ceratobasidium sp. 370]